MIYDLYHLGQLQSGQYITIKVNQVANILLIDDINLPKYQENSFSYIAYNVLQFNFAASYQIPYDGTWHMILEIGELPSLVRATIEIANII